MRRLFTSLLLATALVPAEASSAGTSSVPSGVASAGTTNAAPHLDPRPNILVVVADDLGFSDLGAFGGEISTPNLDRMAQKGVRLTNFYAAPACAPTRAMLLTGQDHHAVGLGALPEALVVDPSMEKRTGYTGRLDPAVDTIAERLAAVGYRTMMAGKWHLGMSPDSDPTRHGFQQSFVLVGGGADHFGDDQDGQLGKLGGHYTENGRPARFPVGQFSADYFTDRMIGFLKAAPDDSRPFFAYMAFTEPHWPLQAPPALIDKYRGRFDAGPAALRSSRLERMRQLGVLDEKTLGAPLDALEDWAALNDQQRARASRAMEVYAAMVESLDINVGRLLASLRVSGRLDNTVILFMSDNGAEGSSQQELAGLLEKLGAPAETRAALDAANNDPQRLGLRHSYAAYGDQWAQAASAPFRFYKGYTENGGIRVPAFIAGPGVKGGRLVNALTSVRDVMPTVLTLAGLPAAPAPGNRNDAANRLPDARSLVPLLDGSAASVRSDTDRMAWELTNRRGIREGKWKAVFRGSPGGGLLPSLGSGWRWHLFDLDNDPGEHKDVSADNPDILARLIEGWNAYARANHVYVPPILNKPEPAQ